MPKFTVDVSEADLKLIERGLIRMNRSDGNTHGPLDLQRLTRMLLEDVALAVRRPGCWEAEFTRQLLSGHGYPI